MKQWATNGERAVALRARKEPRAQQRHPTGMQGTNGEQRQPEGDLLTTTARLALQTARQVRMLTSVVLRTITVPDSSRLAQQLGAIARRTLQYTEDAQAVTWALVVLALLEMAEESTTQEPLRMLREHAAACCSSAALKDSILECSVARTWAGNATNVRIAVAPEMNALANAAVRVMVAEGSTIRYGPAPRGPLERDTAALLSIRQGIQLRS